MVNSNRVKLELGNISAKPRNNALKAIIAAADVLEVDIGDPENNAKKFALYPDKRLKGVSAIAGYRLQRHGLDRSLSQQQSWEAVENAIALALSHQISEWVVFNEMFGPGQKLVRQLGGDREALIRAYETAHAIAPKTQLCLRELFASPWPRILEALADPACKKVIQQVEIQVRCDLGWPPKVQVNKSRIHSRLGWQLKQSRAFRVMRSAQLKELIQGIQSLGYSVTLAECTAWVGAKPSQGLLNAQGKLYKSWLNLAAETGCRISWWDWHDGLLHKGRNTYPDFPGLWTDKGKPKHPEVAAAWNLN